MLGLDLTYTALANSNNDAAADVLTDALEIDDTGIRRRALSGLVNRPEERCQEAVLEHWDQLAPAEIASFATKGKVLAKSVCKALQGTTQDQLRGIEVSQEVGLTEFLPDLIKFAESGDTPEITQAASTAVIKLVTPVGIKARTDAEQSSLRLPIAARLAESVRNHEQHENTDLVDAFLLISHWSDQELSAILDEESPIQNLVLYRLLRSEVSGITDLLAGYIRLRKIPDCIISRLASRQDEAMRNSLLNAIGPEPSKTTLGNIAHVGFPQSLVGGESLLDQIDVDQYSAACHSYVATDDDPFRVLAVLCKAIEKEIPRIDQAASLGLAKCEVPETDQWMRAAITYADHDSESLASDTNACVLSRLIPLLEHREESVARGARRVLNPLSAKNMLPRFRSLRLRSRQKLGEVMLSIDKHAIDQVRDSLRHPVMDQRIDAIIAAEALAAVDTLSESFDKIARNDHLEARLRATAALATANGEDTKQTLLYLASLPGSSVKDAAENAIRQRETLVPTSGT